MFDGLLFGLSKLIGNTMHSYCDVETSENETTIVDDLGGYATVIAFDGAAGIFSTDDLVSQAQTLADALGQMLSESHHQLDIAHVHEPFQVGTIGGEINHLLAGQATAARQIGLNMDRLLVEQAKMLSQLTHHEQTYLVLRTHPGRLGKDERRYIAQTLKKERATYQFERGDPPLPQPHEGVMNHNLGVRGALSVHDSAVTNLINVFKREGYSLRALTAHNAIAEMRRMVSPGRTPRNWSPSLPGDPINLRLHQDGRQPRPQDLLYPTIAEQIFGDEVDTPNAKDVIIGSQIYRGLTAEVHTATIENFGELRKAFARADKNMPWRLMLRLYGNGLNFNAMSRFLLAFLRFVPGPNKKIHEAFDEMRKRFEDKDAIVGHSFEACTWAPANDRELLEQRATLLARCIETWGTARTRDTVGAGLETITATVPGLRRLSRAPVAAAPLDEIFMMSPIATSASPWRGLANSLFRTPDGKLWPYRAYSKLQNSWITMCYAPMGFGKSVMLNALNRGLTLDPENTELPLIRILDVGPSSKGYINLVKYSLPKELQHQAGYFKLKNTREGAVNPFDLPLGHDVPLPSHESYLVELLCTLCTDTNESAPPGGVIGVVRRIVELAYKRAVEEPYPYNLGSNPVVDAAIERHRLQIDPHTTWRELREMLFDCNDIHAAAEAQKFAVPTLTEVAGCTQDETVRAAYGQRIIDGEPMNMYVYRALTTAMGLYPILSDRTKFDLGDARIVSLDLNEVAITGTAAADRQSAIMYMMATRILVADFAFSEEDIPRCPERYRAHFAKVVARSNRVPKRFCADEFHRTSKSISAREGVLVLIREGRKWRLETILASQLLNDFDENMINLATTILILGCGNDGAEETARTFGLGDAGRAHLMHSLKGPGPGGSNFIGVFQTKDAKHTALLTLSLSPMELWAYNTTAVDRNVRDALYKVLPVMDALSLLSHVFPRGSVQDEIDRKVNMRVAKGYAESSADPISEIVDELVASSNKLLREIRKNEVDTFETESAL